MLRRGTHARQRRGAARVPLVAHSAPRGLLPLCQASQGSGVAGAELSALLTASKQRAPHARNAAKDATRGGNVWPPQ